MLSWVSQRICVPDATGEATLARPHLKGVVSQGPIADEAAEVDSKSPRALRRWGTEPSMGSWTVHSSGAQIERKVKQS